MPVQVLGVLMQVPEPGPVQPVPVQTLGGPATQLQLPPLSMQVAPVHLFTVQAQSVPVSLQPLPAQEVMTLLQLSVLDQAAEAFMVSKSKMGSSGTL